MTRVRFDPASAELCVLTFKEGLLSTVAHDLEIRVERFAVTIDDDPLSVHAAFETGSLRVLAAVKDGIPQPTVLSAGDRAKIDETLAAEVLHARQHPEVVFASTSVARSTNGYLVVGTLELHGRSRLVSFVVRELREKLVAEVPLHQPDFGIRPYTAMLGALKVKPDVMVRFVAPRASIDPLTRRDAPGTGSCRTRGRPSAKASSVSRSLEKPDTCAVRCRSTDT